MRSVHVLDAAVEDIEQARDFYDGIEFGVGDYFSDSLIGDLERLSLFHGIHSWHFGFHRMLAGHFPFGIYYRDQEDVTEVFPVLDLRRDPAWLRAELLKR